MSALTPGETLRGTDAADGRDALFSASAAADSAPTPGGERIVTANEGATTIAPTTEIPVQRWKRGESITTTDRVAEEVPVALIYHGTPHVVMLATPADLEDYAIGFTLSEGYVANADEIRSVEVVQGDETLEVRIGIAWERYTALLRRRRNLNGRTGCGLCGAETIEDAIREFEPTTAQGPTVTVEDLHAAIIQLDGLQPLNSQTGSVHAAAWVLPGEGIQLVREDVGRHNALDKTLGALVRAKADFNAGYLLITSRASYEMVQKAATMGIGFVAALSAPTAFAVRLAVSSGITLVGFARRDQHVVYANPERLP